MRTPQSSKRTIQLADFSSFFKYFTLNPYVAIGAGVFYPRRTFYPVALKPLRIATKVFVTFPEYMWAKKTLKNNSDISISISNMAAGKWTLN